MDHIPPVGFYFNVEVSPFTGRSYAGFQEVTGISAKIDIATITEGSENCFVHNVPGRVTYEDLVLYHQIALL